MSKREEDGVYLIAEERRRQIEEEGWSSDHDDEHVSGSLSNAAMCYAAQPGDRRDLVDESWPFDRESWKPSPKNRVRELIKAGALIAAEIDRIIRYDQESV